MWTLSGFADEISAEPAEQFRTLADLGIRHVELRSAWGTNVLDLDDEQLARVGVLLRDYGLGVSAIGSPIGKIGVADDFGPHLAAFERCLSVAARFEAPLIRLFSFFVPQTDFADVHRAEVMRRMTALADRAVGHDRVAAAALGGIEPDVGGLEQEFGLFAHPGHHQRPGAKGGRCRCIGPWCRSS